MWVFELWNYWYEYCLASETDQIFKRSYFVKRMTYLKKTMQLIKEKIYSQFVCCSKSVDLVPSKLHLLKVLPTADSTTNLWSLVDF